MRIRQQIWFFYIVSSYSMLKALCDDCADVDDLGSLLNANHRLLLNDGTREEEKYALRGVPTPDMIRKAGYPVERHFVTTEDGYILTLHRIPGEQGSKPVFLQHGILGSSADWVIPGKGKALAYILADENYDLWLGNARGNTYSRCNVNISSSNPKFWDFSWHEMGVYDLPAVVKYISNLTNNRITYIGHSMGTSMFYVFASQMPQLQTKIKAMFSLAPIAFMNHMRSPLRVMAILADDVKIYDFLGAHEFAPENGVLDFLARYLCDHTKVQRKICENALFAFFGFDQHQFNDTLIPVILSHTPAGTSTKTFVHFAREIRNGKFCNYDCSLEYDLSKILVPVGLFYADNDWLASTVDVARLEEKLPHVAISFKVEYPKFNHLDYIYGIDAPVLVYKKLLSAMNKIFVNT